MRKEETIQTDEFFFNSTNLTENKELLLGLTEKFSINPKGNIKRRNKCLHWKSHTAQLSNQSADHNEINFWWKWNLWVDVHGANYFLKINNSSFELTNTFVQLQVWKSLLNMPLNFLHLKISIRSSQQCCLRLFQKILASETMCFYFGIKVWATSLT